MAVRNEGFRAPVLWLLLPYMAGLLMPAETFRSHEGLWLSLCLVAAILAVLVAGVFRGRWAAALWCVCVPIAASLLGALRISPLTEHPERWRTLPPREATLEVRIIRVFPPSARKPTPSALAEIHAAPRLLQDLQGQRVHLAQVILPGGRLPVRSEVLQVSGLIESVAFDPASISWGSAKSAGADSFREYLLNHAVHFRLGRCRVEAELEPASLWARGAAALGARFADILRAGLPAGAEATGAYLGMFLGRKDTMSDEQRLDYLHTGAMHLFAISGLHIAVIAACMHGVLRFVPMPGVVRAVVGIAALLIFVEATGGTPSARRALVMVGLMWMASSLRRPTNPVASIATAAFGVLLFDPLALRSLSFQFSYSVVAMLLLYAAPLTNRWLNRWHPWAHIPDDAWTWHHRLIFFGGRRLIILTCTSWSAALISTPLTVAHFGIATPGAVLANLVLVPVALFSITAGFASLVVGLCGLTWLSIIFNHAAAMILWAMNSFARAAADWPGMYFEGRFQAGWIAPALVGAMLVLCLAGYALRWRRATGGLLMPPVVMIAALVFLVTRPAPSEESAAMKSAYELAMERLQRSQPDADRPLTAEQKERLAEINRVYQGKIAEREIFLKQRLADVQGRGELEEAEKIRQQMAGERARLEEEREAEKERVRRSG